MEKQEPDFVSAEKNRLTVSDYERESVCQAARHLLKLAHEARANDVADLASNILLDLTENTIEPARALTVIQTLEATLNKQAPALQARRYKPVRIGASLVAAAILLAFAATIMVAGIKDRHQQTFASVPAEWQYKPVTAIPTSKSLNGLRSTHFAITNKTSHSVYLYWLDYNGEPVAYNSIAPGETVSQQTYATHPWVVRDEDGTNRMLFIAGTRDMEQIIVK